MANPKLMSELIAHLQAVLNKPDTPLDTALLLICRSEFSKAGDHSPDKTQATTILHLAIPILFTTTQEPDPLTSMLEAATSCLSFSDILALDLPVDFGAGLRAPLPSINKLTLNLLQRAIYSAADCGILAGAPEPVKSLVELWLSTEDAGVAKICLQLLLSLLDTDVSERENPLYKDKTAVGAGQGLMWKRIFQDVDVYGSLFSMCAEKTPRNAPGKSALELSRNRKSVAQSRLFDFIAEVSRMDWGAISTSHIRDVELAYGSTSLLDFAITKMIDTTDILSTEVLVAFLATLLEHNALQSDEASKTDPLPVSYAHTASPALLSLLESGLHDAIIASWLDENAPRIQSATSISCLDTTAADYLSTYLKSHPGHFLKHGSIFHVPILQRLTAILSASSNWTIYPPRSNAIKVLTSLPPILLLRFTQSDLNILKQIPISPSHASAINTLEALFTTSTKEQTISSAFKTSYTQRATNSTIPSEIAAKYYLYNSYINSTTSEYIFWKTITKLSTDSMNPDLAFAALAFMKSLCSTRWPAVPSSLMTTYLDTNITENQSTLSQPKPNLTISPPTITTTNTTLLTLRTLLSPTSKPFLLPPLLNTSAQNHTEQSYKINQVYNEFILIFKDLLSTSLTEISDSALSEEDVLRIVGVRKGELEDLNRRLEEKIRGWSARGNQRLRLGFSVVSGAG